MDKILIIGAGGQIGVELTLALREIYGRNNVIATDIKEEHPLLKADNGPFMHLDVMDFKEVAKVVSQQNITQVYLLAAILSATGESKPIWAWDINMQSLLNLLEICRENKVKKFYWPSSIAAFGTTTALLDDAPPPRPTCDMWRVAGLCRGRRSKREKTGCW